jgi:hypothetical protein
MRTDTQRMDSPPTQVRAAFVGGVFAVLTACITGTFLIANTLIQNGFVISGPVVQAGGSRRAAETATPDALLDTYVEAGSLLCALGGPVAVKDAAQPVEFSGQKGATIVCWIGPQQARASIASGTIVRQVSLDREDLQAAALSAARGFAKELGERVEIAIIAQDGSVSGP